ncbi:unnamed protein product [Closterium sp. NIES-64]|nr:unnamed protein product [Closterium sp. NIES-64]
MPSPSSHPCRHLHYIPAVPFIPSLPSPSSHPCRPLHPIPAVTFIQSLPSPSSHPCRHLHPIPAVPFIPSLPSPSSHPCRPLHPILVVPFIPSLSSPLTRPSVTFPPSLPSRIQSTAPNQYSGAAPPVKVITEATKHYELVPVKKTPFVAASCDRRQEHGGVSNVELDQFERRVMARFAEMLSAILRGAGPSVPIGAPAATPPHSGPSTSSSEGLPSSNSPLANHRKIVYKAVVDFKA